MLRVGRIALCVALGGLALLIWARLRLVTGVPRTALAEPRPTISAPSTVRLLLAAEGEPRGR